MSLLPSQRWNINTNSGWIFRHIASTQNKVLGGNTQKYRLSLFQSGVRSQKTQISRRRRGATRGTRRTVWIPLQPIECWCSRSRIPQCEVTPANEWQPGLYRDAWKLLTFPSVLVSSFTTWNPILGTVFHFDPIIMILSVCVCANTPSTIMD